MNRAAILETLSAEGPMSRRDLQGRFDIARTTVGLNLEGLEERGWVRAVSDGTYALTDAGALLARGIGEFADADKPERGHFSPGESAARWRGK